MPLRLSLRFALFALALLGALLLGAAPARAAEPGVVADLTWYVPDSDKQRTGELLDELGSRWVRLHVRWREAEPQPGVFDEWWMDEYENALTYAEAAGQQVVLMISEAPAWASGDPAHNVPADPRLFANFLERFAERFEGRVAAYEIWNEPNIERFWSTGPDAAEYAALLAASHAVLREADPETLVVFGGLSTNDYDFLEAAYDAGAKGHFDVLATHPYPYCGSSGPAAVSYSGGRISRDSFTGYRELRASMLARGDDKPIWITEFGWNTSQVACDPGSGQWQGGVSEQAQAEHLTQALRILESDPYVEVAIWYALRNNVWSATPDDPAEPEANFGLVRTDFAPKPAFYAFKDYANPAPQKTATTLKGFQNTNSTAHKPQAVGRVRNADEGWVRIVVRKRKNNGKWRAWEKVEVPVGPDGSFQKRVSTEKKGTYRIFARYLGTPRFRPSVSPKRPWDVARDKN